MVLHFQRQNLRRARAAAGGDKWREKERSALSAEPETRADFFLFESVVTH
jgi:hypothetical protein